MVSLHREFDVIVGELSAVLRALTYLRDTLYEGD